MANESDEIKRQTRRHLESLRMAGIEWIAKAPDALPNPQNRGNEASLPMLPLEELAGSSSAESTDSLTREEREGLLATLAERVSKCTRCPHLASTRTQTVFGVGPLDPELCFIGEAPGFQEDAQGEPFVGDAGQLLNKIIQAMGMRRQDVFICNILRCRPPGNRTPNPEEAGNCREYLKETLQLVRPKHICCLGACAAQNLLGTTQSIGGMRGKTFNYQGIPVFCTYHPAYLLRNPEQKKNVWEDMKKLLVHMGKPIP